MALSEFELIGRYFAGRGGGRSDVVLGVGDDCALLAPPPGRLLAVTTDTLVEGRHFDAGCDPEALGHKALAVNLSDLAAMGATPAWATLALTLPQADPDWLDGFSRGFAALAAAHDLALVGGDTTRGPRSITVQLIGTLPAGLGLRRGGARPGDRLFVSGTVGDASWALAEAAAGRDAGELRARLERPSPRLDLGRTLLPLASAAIDVSDGLAADLGHICSASAVGARVDLAALPLSAPVAALCAGGDWRLPLAGGDDYELLFTVPAERCAALREACAAAAQRVTEIGEVVAGSGVTLVYPDGRIEREAPGGFDHFRS